MLLVLVFVFRYLVSLGDQLEDFLLPDDSLRNRYVMVLLSISPFKIKVRQRMLHKPDINFHRNNGGKLKI